MPTTLYQSKNHWNHYRIDSARASWWDYGKNGDYYVTICTKHKYPFFGSIRNGQMQLSKIGRLVEQFWKAIPEHTIAGVRMESFVIMPNHIHGIIVLDRAAGLEPLQEEVDVETLYYRSPQEYAANPPHPHSDFAPARSAFFAQVRPRKGSLPQILRSFKAVVTKVARQEGYLEEGEVLWQSRFYDRVIRDEWEYDRIERHIERERQQWEQDDYHYVTLVGKLKDKARQEYQPVPLSNELGEENPQELQIPQQHKKSVRRKTTDQAVKQRSWKGHQKPRRE